MKRIWRVMRRLPHSNRLKEGKWLSLGPVGLRR